MKVNRILSFVCVLALALSMFSMFSFAVNPEAEAEVEAGDSVRSPYYCYAKINTYIYKSRSTADPQKHYVTTGEQLLIVNTNNTTTWRHVRTMNGSFDGYILRTHIIEPG